MTWAPPTTPPDASSNTATPPPETDAERRRLSAVPAAAWIALLGSALVLAAAAAVVATNWDTIGRSVRVAGLVAATAGLVIAAERLRSLVPTSASIIAHAGTALTASVGIAMLSLFGVTWPGCLLAGGVVLIVATEFQAGRWRRVTMHLAQIAGWAIAATGAAALLGTSAGLVAMIGSVALLAAGAQRRSVSLAVLAVLSPALTALADAGIGDGTLLRAGLVGERLGWSGPAVGLLAGTVIGAIALHRRNNPLVLVAAASPVIGVVTGLAAADGSAVAWWSVPGLALIAAELALWLLPTDRFRSAITELVDVGAVGLAFLVWFTPVVAGFLPFDTGTTHPWAIPIVVAALALALSTLRWRSSDRMLGEVGLAALAAASIGLVVTLGAPTVATAGTAVLMTALAALASRRLSPLAILPTAAWALFTIEVLAGDATWANPVGLGLLAALVTTVVAARARLAAANGPLGWLEMAAVAAGAAIGALTLIDGASDGVGLAAVALSAALIALVERRLTTWSVGAVAVAGVVALDAATSTGSLTGTYWVGWTAATAAFSVLWVCRRADTTAAAAASAAVLTLATFTAAAGISPVDVTIMAMLAVTALTGVAFVFERRPALDAAAVTAGVVLLITTMFDIDPIWASAAWFVLGLQITIAGTARRVPVVQVGGAVITVVALISGWFTSGWHAWFVELIEPADIRIGDLWLAGATVAALVAGLALRSALGANSWVAYTASLLIPGLWLTSVHLDRGTVWALPLLLVIGVTAAGLGAWHRLAAPLVGGTALALTAGVVAIGTDLTAVPTWTWLAVGGAALLGTAVLIERRGQPGVADLRALISRWN